MPKLVRVFLEMILLIRLTSSMLTVYLGQILMGSEICVNCVNEETTLFLLCFLIDALIGFIGIICTRTIVRRHS